MSTVADTLREAKALIDTPEKWTQGRWHSDGCYCMGGAVARAATGETEPFAQDFRSPRTYTARHALEAVIGGDIMAFNDSHAHAEVMAAFDRAIATAEASS